MKIEFIGPAVSVPADGISFRAKVDGHTVACIFSLEALEDVNPATSLLCPEEQFKANRDALLAAAKRKIHACQIKNNIVRIFTTDLR